MKEKFDVVVIGGGPAGCVAAWHAAKGGASVLLLEKNRSIGPPVRCAEGVGDDGLRLIVEPQPFFIQNRLEGIRFIAPNGSAFEIETEKHGYILNRNVFDFYLAQLAAKEGAEIRTKAYVDSLLLNEGRITGVKFQALRKSYSVESSIVIGADGVESRMGRMAGIRTQLKMKDVESCIQYKLANVDMDTLICNLYFSREISPGGYAWVFPTGEGTANVGLGISGEYGKRYAPKDLLDRFVARLFPAASVLAITVGGVPVTQTLREIVKPGFMLAGDAARQTNPLSGGGIVSGMIAGKLAGQVAAEAVQKGNFSQNALKEYEKRWYKAEGNYHKMYYRLKETIYKLSDDDLNRATQAILKLPAEKRHIINIFKAVLFQKPSLMFDVMILFKDHVKNIINALGK